MQCSIPSTTEFNKITQTFRSRKKLVGSVSVARVRPRTSKGITAFTPTGGAGPRSFGQGLTLQALLAEGISTYLNSAELSNTLPRVTCAHPFTVRAALGIGSRERSPNQVFCQRDTLTSGEPRL